MSDQETRFVSLCDLLIKKYDVNNDGGLNKDQFWALLENPCMSGAGISRELCDSIFKSVDIDGDGKISS